MKMFILLRSDESGYIFLVIFILIIVFLVGRELACWYWKINTRISLQEEQNKLLQELININKNGNDSIKTMEADVKNSDSVYTDIFDNEGIYKEKPIEEPVEEDEVLNEVELQIKHMKSKLKSDEVLVEEISTKELKIMKKSIYEYEKVNRTLQKYRLIE